MERQARDLRETVTVALEVCDQMPGSLILATDVLHVAVRKCVCSRVLLAGATHAKNTVDIPLSPRCEHKSRSQCHTPAPPGRHRTRSLFRHRTPNRERPRYPLRVAATHRGMRRTHPSLLHSHHCPRESEPPTVHDRAMSQTPDHDHGTP